MRNGEIRKSEVQRVGFVRVPSGWVGLAWTTRGVCGVTLPKSSKAACERSLRSSRPRSHPAVEAAIPQPWRLAIQAALRGVPMKVQLPLDLRGAPAFSRSVWKATSSIPLGETRSYQWVARRLGQIRGMQAVGQALKRNPVPLLVPCHRVIRASQAVGGFSGGRGWKERLLVAEGVSIMGKTVVPSRRIIRHSEFVLQGPLPRNPSGVGIRNQSRIPHPASRTKKMGC